MAKSKKRLWLGVYRREAGYVNGSVEIGLFEASNEEEARGKMAEQLGGYGEDALKYHQISVTPVNGPVLGIMSIPTTYDD